MGILSKEIKKLLNLLKQKQELLNREHSFETALEINREIFFIEEQIRILEERLNQFKTLKRD